ncbi:aldo/keto reductase [Succinivibrio dextrinosolvens]|uniref:aldo/keto reductase n=1 Tax=Succinivibrio dextrinosolvens TaxID=83771 RepID=UPI00241EFEFC|nr:aldo/keto reductase [Succinivibrio dextrinosolvens]MBE6421918.1 aldo/keto reductase [Succinivibrio dextrinosolvens]
MHTFTLNDGNKIPAVGFGTFQIPADGSTYKAVKEALNIGYRHFDTAAAYFNEKEVGKAVNDSGIRRDEIFVTSKLWLQDYAYEDAVKAIDKSLEKLNLDYIDLYLIHQPYGKVDEAWRAMEEAQKAGKIKSIGVSNMTVKIWDKFKDCFSVMPAVNQVEYHPMMQQKELSLLMGNNNVLLEAWAPLYQGNKLLLDNPVIKELAAKYNKTVAQIVLRFENQMGVIILPKSTHTERIKENLEIFDFSLSDEEMKMIQTLNQEKGIHNPDNPGVGEWLLANFDVHKDD